MLAVQPVALYRVSSRAESRATASGSCANFKVRPHRPRGRTHTLPSSPHTVSNLHSLQMEDLVSNYESLEALLALVVPPVRAVSAAAQSLRALIRSAEAGALSDAALAIAVCSTRPLAAWAGKVNIALRSVPRDETDFVAKLLPTLAGLAHLGLPHGGTGGGGSRHVSADVPQGRMEDAAQAGLPGNSVSRGRAAAQAAFPRPPALGPVTVFDPADAVHMGPGCSNGGVADVPTPAVLASTDAESGSAATMGGTAVAGADGDAEAGGDADADSGVVPLPVAQRGEKKRT